MCYMAWLLTVSTYGYANTNHSAPRQCFAHAKDAYAYLIQQEKTSNHTTTVININTASAGELMSLDGVGVKTAEAIVLYREQMGRFSHVDEITNVKGIGKKTLENNRHRLVVE